MQKEKIRPWPIAFSKLTRRILAINIVALAIIGGGILYLDQNRHALTQDRLKTLQSDVQSKADNLSIDYLLKRIESSAQVQGNQTLDTKRLEVLLEEAVLGTTNRLRLYDHQNKLIADTTTNPPPAIEVSELPPPGTESSTKHHEHLDKPSPERFLSKFLQLISEWLASLDGSFLNKITNTSELSGKGQCSLEPPVSKDQDGHRILNVSSPVLPWEFKDKTLTAKAALIPPFTGCLLLTASISDIAQQVQKDRMELVWLSAIALSITLLLSLYLARSIIHPIRQLAASAEKVTRKPNVEHNIPDLSGRGDEIGDLSLALQQMGDSLSERINAIERFAGDVAHELKNPLASLSSTNELLERYGNDTDFRRHLARQADDISRMDRLISEILDDARLDSELANALTKKVELNNLLSTLTQVYNETGLVGKTRLDFKNEANTTSVVFGDEQQLARVIQNLVDNSIAFSPPDGLILIRLSCQDGNVQILVDDQGPGVPHDNLEKIFEPFVTHSPEGDKLGHHSGLGLSIAKKIVRRHSGAVWAENKYNVQGNISGSRFIVQIPAAA
ncbi:MAG: ATP-binding protein [Pseudomonadota bacterium]|nr:ATP-binding protein [Pseudomonadota bacterium]